MKKTYLLILLAIFLLVGCKEAEPNDEATEPEVNVEQPEEEQMEETEQNEEAIDEIDIVEEEEEVVTIQEPQYKINEGNWSIEPISDANEKVVLLTFDDAPDKYAVEIAHTLKELGVKAIFFVNGHFINTDEGAAKLKEIYDLGFPIGNHTYSHPNLKQISEEKQYEEIVSLNDRVEEITGERPKFFRAPFGVNTDYSKQIVAEENMVLMNWTYGYDWERDYQNKEALADIMVNSPYLRDGANLLMHDRKWTMEAVKDIVNGLLEKGYEIVDPELIQTP